MDKDKLFKLFNAILSGKHKDLGTINYSDPIQTYFSIEKLLQTDQIELANEIWKQNFTQNEEFIPDVLLMKIAYHNQEYKLVQEIQVYWQVKIDKFDNDVLLNLYIGFFYKTLGKTYCSMEEYELAAHKLSKADSYFVKIGFDIGQYMVHKLIGMALNQLGAYGDARYHYREIINRDISPESKDRVDTYYQLGLLYKLDKKREEAVKTFNIVIELAQPESEIYQLTRTHLTDLESQI